MDKSTAKRRFLIAVYPTPGVYDCSVFLPSQHQTFNHRHPQGEAPNLSKGSATGTLCSSATSSDILATKWMASGATQLTLSTRKLLALRDERQA